MYNCMPIYDTNLRYCNELVIEDVEQRNSSFDQTPVKALNSLFEVFNAQLQVLKLLLLLSDFLTFLAVMSKFNAASALVNSFDSLASSAPTLLVFIILVTNDQLVIDVEDEASAEDLNMPSNSEIRGCCLEGKLLDRTRVANKEEAVNNLSGSTYLHKRQEIFGKTASTLANSFTTSSSQPTLLLCTSLETRDQPPSLDCVFGPEIKDNKDSNAARVTASTSLKTLTKAAVSLSLVEVEATYFDSTPFKLFKAFWIAFLTTFLEADKGTIESTATL
ncbi:hypothetical protein F8388_007180 [Cannabis sativa]|uniref:Uncharacterized protein n=1 Tax=Cannabis sativa TaxID=3483 RepID=A0A7J6EH22_CANSA|nr:hypothetical protein F8388_007180 [Cannabis sativa]